MTLDQWLAAQDPDELLLHLWDTGRGTERKCNLLAVGFSRLESPADELATEGLEMAERLAEGHATLKEVGPVLGRHWQAWEFLEELLRRRNVDMTPDQQARLPALFACIFGDPRRPLPSVPEAVLTWNGGMVVKLARSLYDDRILPESTFDTGRLAVLADALEAAGCSDPEILGHLRGEGPHVRGCWGVDLLLKLA